MTFPSRDSIQHMFGELATLRQYAFIVVESGGKLTDSAQDEKNLLMRRFFEAGHSLNWTDGAITKLLLKEVI